MKLKILGSSSHGNCYLLISDDGEVLIIEAGIKLLEVKKALDFDISGIFGCIVSHEHGDHAKYVSDYLGAGIEVWLSAGTNRNIKYKDSRLAYLCEAKEKFKIGNFTILPFDTNHDAEEPLGFVINHPEMGNCLFLTDSFYSRYKFPNMNQILIEANYDADLVDEKWYKDQINDVVYGRLKESHMSIQTCREMLLKNDLSKVKNIILLHLSNANSDAKKFKEEIVRATGKKVTVADRGIEIDFNLNTF